MRDSKHISGGTWRLLWNKQTITVSNPFLMKAEKVHEHDSQKPGFSK
jgi:hypothetical protein